MISHSFRLHRLFALLVALFLGTAIVHAQNSGEAAKAAKKPGDAAAQQSAQQEEDPLKRKPTKKQEQAATVEKMGRVYKKWLDEDVRWIITDEELSAFKKLATNAERDQFIEAFWQRRDPTPDTEENEFKEEHYRRIAYADERFAAGIRGSRTDRGRIYIMYGKPDTIDAHPAGGP